MYLLLSLPACLSMGILITRIIGLIMASSISGSGMFSGTILLLGSALISFIILLKVLPTIIRKYSDSLKNGGFFWGC